MAMQVEIVTTDIYFIIVDMIYCDVVVKINGVDYYFHVATTLLFSQISTDYAVYRSQQATVLPI